QFHLTLSGVELSPFEEATETSKLIFIGKALDTDLIERRLRLLSAPVLPDRRDHDTATVIFQPSGRRGNVAKGTSIIEASRLLGGDIKALCSEQKVCGKCIVKIEEGRFEKNGIRSGHNNASPWQQEEEQFINSRDREKGFRLGCAARIEGDLLIFVPEASRAVKQVVRKEARDIRIEHDPAVRLYPVKVSPPTLSEPTGDFERVCQALEKDYGLKNLTIDLHALRQLPVVLRDAGWSVTLSVWNDKEIIRVRPGRKERAYGMAIDVGTTTVAAYFCDLTTMEIVNTVSMMNPQCKYGEDVMARILYHRINPDGLERMRADIVEGINDLIARAVDITHLSLEREDIEDITIGFNTAMHHILLGLNPEYVGLAPFPPVIHHSLDIKARDLNIGINDSSYIFALPNEAGFVGGDNVGVLLAEEPYKHDETQLIIDIGTN
ncbi:MAG: 2Fe-2S iron-sulfur cluster-binding protein, partial [Desulfobacterales bacterium]|nr:2Fe-2S iron-sulfur cluster-binding protein [Desulfobacterales bacterium]